MRHFLLFFVLFGGSFLTSIKTQISVSVTIDSAVVTTACSDIFGGPDPTYRVSVNGNDFVTYDFGANACFLTAPDTPYDTLVNGACNLPLTVEVCVQAFDNDLDFIPCAVFPECFEQICQDVTLPTAGSSTQEQISLSGSTDGEFYFTLTTTEDPTDFNYVCGAVDLGLLGNADTLGDASLGVYDNSCADNLNEPNPAVDDNVNLPNNHGVWFTYTTGPDANTLTYVRVFSDPENTGDPIDLELLVYSADSCTGELTRFPLFRRRSNGDDASIELYCAQPNTTYYVLVDGRGNTDDTQQGVFSIQVEDTGLPEGGDLRCDATDLGPIPDNATVQLPTPQGNFCAGFVDDPAIVINFNSRNSVWVRFEAPASGHVAVDATSVAPLGIDLELGLYQSTTDECDGIFQHLYSGWDNSSFDESFTFSCLDPGRPYWVLIDGSASQAIGYFDLQITDLGDIRPVTNQIDTICAGDSFAISPTISYTNTGVYTDTIKIPGTNCDSIIITDLTVLDTLNLSFVQTQPALGVAATDGRGEVTTSGGAGNYQFSWCDGSTGPTNDNLVAGTNCCVSVTDSRGCLADTCFVVDFVVELDPSFASVPTSCNGDSTGSFTFSVTGGRPDFNWSWTNGDGSLSETGTLTAENIPVAASDLPAGNYVVDFSGQFFDTTFTISVGQPPALTLTVDQFTPISCFQACDGVVTVSAAGGTPPLNVERFLPAAGDGCAGMYRFVVTDANGCQTELERELTEPAEFIASVASSQDVSCFDGDDGSVTITTNGNPTDFAWDNGASGASLTGLTPGTYVVTVTNVDGCQDVLTHQVDQPAAPLDGSIQESNPITCATDADGALTVNISGGTNPVSVLWDDGANTATISGLAPGDYGVTLTDANGCSLPLTTTLQAPLPILAQTESRDIRCPDPSNAGRIAISQVVGGVGPYEYALNGTNFSPDTLFSALEAGRYDVTIRDALGCELVVPTSVLPPPELIADLGGDREVLLGDSLRLAVIANSTNALYQWSIDPSLTDNAVIVRPRDNTSVTVTVIDTLTECIASSTIQLLVDRRPRLFLPTAFSPNGDGVNDMFYPFAGNDVRTVSDFRIFGRFGDLVFERGGEFAPNNADSGWDGRVGGQLAAIGVYVYTATVSFFDGRVETINGEVTLLR